MAATTVGDSRFTLMNNNGELTHAQVDTLNRHVLGGALLGDIITSSGNVVKEVTSASDIPVTIYEDITRFVVVSDGAYVGGDDGAEDNQAIGELLKVPTATAQQIAKAILERALRAFDEWRKKPDNVTVLVGFRRGT